MSHMLPEKGLWHVTDRYRADAAPFDLIKLDLRGRETGVVKGTVRARNLETRLGRIRVTRPDRFVAAYDIRGHRGNVEGTVRPDGSLRLDLSGTVTGSFVVRPADSVAGDSVAADPAGAGAPSAVRGALAGAVETLCRSAGMRTAAA
jgi:hypothetical protein